MSRNDIEYDRFYKGSLLDFAGVAESSIPNGFSWFVMYAKSYQDLLIIVMVFVYVFITSSGNASRMM